ncbi:MAG: hypothetical protein K2Y51_25945 [Gammaproteobacteria bacterium]|nr:hypothetical protein [Gammaproteobacteria bacterium]
MSFSTPYLIAGAARGLSEGLDDLDRQKRQRVDDQYKANAEIRAQNADARASEEALRAKDREGRAKQSHDQSMKLGNIRLEEAEDEQEHKQFTRELDDVMGRLIATDGEDYKGLESLYNERYPDGNKVVINRDPATKKFTLDFGNGRVAKDLDLEQVAGMASYMADPKEYIEEKRKQRERDAEEQRLIDREDRAEERAIAREDRAERRRAPAYKVGDDGGLYAVRGETMRPVTVEGGAAPADPAPAGAAPAGPQRGLTPTFKGSERGGQSALIKDVEAFAGPPKAGETREQRYARGAAERAKAIGGRNNDPMRAVMAYEQAITAKMIDSSVARNPERLAQAREQITAMVQDFKQRHLGIPPTTPGPAPGQPAAAQPGAAQPGATLPDAMVGQLKEGVGTRFRNGQVWTLINGQPVQVE